MDIITIIDEGHCKWCQMDLPKGIEAVLDDGFIFCLNNEDENRATCHDKYLEAESGFNNEKLL